MNTTDTDEPTELEQLILDGYDAAEEVAQLLYSALSADHADSVTIAQNIFRFAFEAGLELGHEIGHRCANKANPPDDYTPSGYL